MRSPSTLLAVAFLALAACSAPSKKESSAAAPSSGGAASAQPASASASRYQPTPWTNAFDQACALLAAEVTIEGPPGLISHVASVSDPEELDRSEKVVPEGFLQVISVKPGSPTANIKAQLDRLAIVALEKLTILERPQGTAVIVTAKGDVYWENSTTHDVKRGETLRFEGKVGEKAGR
jgi:hypothetical protein